MKKEDMECAIVEELMPIYVDNLTEEPVSGFIEHHLEQCESCNDIYQKMKSDIHISSLKEGPEHNKDILKYVNSIKVWYLLCPLFALLLYRLELSSVLKLYEGILLLFSVTCILSEIYHKGAWWDQECIGLQEEAREDAKSKRGIFYIRPFLWMIPSILVLLVLEWDQIIFSVGDFLQGMI